MIATGLVFLLGALVATLLALLFVPVLWRNAQRLARRDFAATMPATMSEIRAEVDRVRAESAVNLRRHEIQAAKARERLALAKGEVGRLTGANAKLTFGADQHIAEANSLRGQIAGLEEKLRAGEDERLRLQGENEELKELLAEVETEIQAIDERSRLVPPAASAAPEDSVSPRLDDRDEPDAARVAAATNALLALAREHRRARRPENASEPTSAQPAGGTPQATGAQTSTSAMGAVPPRATAEGQVVEELRALASAPRPSEPAARQRQNGQVRERIADVAARIIQLTLQKEGPDGPTAKLLRTNSKTAGDEGTMTPDLAERVRRLSGGTSRVHEAPTQPLDESPGENVPEALVTAPAGRAKRKRGASRSRPPSRR